MTDPLGWLKLGPRARTPSTPLSASLPECRAAREPQSSDHRRPRSSRMSGQVIQPESSLESLPIGNTDDDAAASLFVRNQDRIWYNPSLDQMVEALQVLLMTRGVLEPIPIEYNSYILHLIEGFAKARENVRKAEGAYQELKQSLEQNLDQFRLVVNDWLKRESQYQAEVKRLEVLLSKSSRDGLEAVTLARTNSVVDRSGTKHGAFLSRLNELKTDHLDGAEWLSTPLASSTPLTPRILDEDNDFLLSEKFRRQDMTGRAPMTVSRDGRADQYHAANKTFTATTHSRWRDTVIKATTTGHTEKPTSSSGEANSTKGGRHGFRNPFAASARGRHQGTLEEQPLAKTQTRGEISTDLSSLGTYHHQENTSDIPNIMEPNGTTTAGLASRHKRYNSGFSFEPGDDCDGLPGNPAMGHGDFDVSYCEQDPSFPSPAHSTLESVANEKCRSRGYVDGLINDMISSKERRAQRENDSIAIHHSLSESPTLVQSPAGRPVRRSRDSGGSGRSTIKASPSQGCHSRGSPVTASVGEQETPQRQQTETDARIAATVALANALGSTGKKK
ncbi:hypothetical protein F4803DRAFT_556864 [Xylaria telfairii]|nr:hypothetical protein F4803DRAFT_556864 [Xylaria telfairii]